MSRFYRRGDVIMRPSASETDPDTMDQVVAQRSWFAAEHLRNVWDVLTELVPERDDEEGSEA